MEQASAHGGGVEGRRTDDARRVGALPQQRRASARPAMRAHAAARAGGASRAGVPPLKVSGTSRASLVARARWTKKLPVSFFVPWGEGRRRFWVKKRFVRFFSSLSLLIDVSCQHFSLSDISFRSYLDVVGFASIHVYWSGLGWNLVQLPLQSTPTHVD